MALGTYAEVLSTTIDHYVPQMEDNIFTSKPLLWALKNANRVKNFHGVKIVQPLMYAENPNQGVYADDDVFATAAMTGLDAAEYDWRQLYGLVHFTGLELAKNSGEEAVLSLLEARMTQLEMTVAENLNDELWNGTNASNRWLGLEKSVGTQDNAIGGIDSTSATWWDPQQDNNSGASRALSLALMRTVYNSCSEGNDHPTNIFTIVGTFEDYEGLIAANARFMDPTMADGGFQNLLFKGTPMTFDTQIDTHLASALNPMYFLNMKYITLAKLDDVWFKPSEFLAPTNADVLYKHIRCYGQLVLSNRSRQGALIDLAI
jgi:hypothetical protein